MVKLSSSVPSHNIIRRKRINNSQSGNNRKKDFNLSHIVACAMAVLMCIYIAGMVIITRYTKSSTQFMKNADEQSKSAIQNNPKPLGRYFKRQEWGDKVEPLVPRIREWGHGVHPDVFMDNNHEMPDDPADIIHHENSFSDDNVLTAYLEPVYQDTWTQKPLPIRNTTASILQKVTFPKLRSCQKMPEQWPIDEYPDGDPFLPWIHDVFPTHDGRFIQFVAQNRRRCRTGTTPEETKILKEQQPQIALFQHVAVKRVRASASSVNTTTRYRLSNHREADTDGLATRFICRFKPSMEETLSIFNADYEWATFRKKQKKMFSEEGRDNKNIHTSQLIFQCPVPPNLQQQIRSGMSVPSGGDYPTLFVDLIPIRTPPRYGVPNAFFQPKYREFQANKPDEIFNADLEYGKHILPTIENSGRWENIPICKPSLMTFGPNLKEQQQDTLDITSDAKEHKEHNLVSCIWASTGYATRGNRFAILDGQRRLLEWITYNKLIGFDHFYVYDNSGAFGDTSLKPITDLFPGDVTYINWPSKVCNNNPNNVDSVGERSSQYAAEASCRLRFGPHVNWIGQFDIDEYLVPMGNMTSILPVLDKLDQEGNKIISFGSWRAWPRRKFIEDPIKLTGPAHCGKYEDCFQLKIPLNYTMLQAYSCDRQKPGQKKSKMPAEKQIYRPDYVKQHFIHYSTITNLSEMNREEVESMGMQWNDRRAFPDPLSRFGDEVNEALMLHTKAVATQDTVGWEYACQASYQGRTMCRLGNPFPDGFNASDDSVHGDENGLAYNCYLNRKIDDFWVPLLEEKLKVNLPELAKRDL